jgi:ATP-binding cassette, subfamily B, heavy metal transporter
MSRDRGGQRRRIDRVREVKFKDELKAVGKLLPFLWPRDNWELRIRVLIAVSFLIVAKSLTVYVPMFYKHAVDALSPGKALLIAVPVMLIVGYGVARVGAQLFAELRDAVFAKVGQRAVRQVALATFRHLHQL